MSHYTVPGIHFPGQRKTMLYLLFAVGLCAFVIARHHSNADAKATRPTVVRIMPPSGLQILPKIYLPKISSTSSLFLYPEHMTNVRAKNTKIKATVTQIKTQRKQTANQKKTI